MTVTYLIDSYRHRLDTTNDEVVVELSISTPDGVFPAGRELLSDAELDATAKAAAVRREDESWEAYGARMVECATWTQETVRRALQRRKGLPVQFREPVKLVLATSPSQEKDDGDKDKAGKAG